MSRLTDEQVEALVAENAKLRRVVRAAKKLLVHDLAADAREKLPPCIEAVHLDDALIAVAGHLTGELRTMSISREKFGAFIRREREGKEIGLREMAKMIGVSPTYQSKVERDEFPPPAEDKVRAIAKIIECDVDDLLARAGRVSTDITDIIKRHPVELAALLRTIKGLTADDIARLARQAQKAKDD